MIVGSDYVWSIERLYKKYLEEAGAEVSFFAAQNRFYEYYHKSVFRKLLFRAGLSGVLGQINESLLAEVERLRPDVIWVFKGMELYPKTLSALRKTGTLLVNFNGDNPFIFTSRGSGNKYVYQSLPLYDLHFTYNLEIKARLDREYNAKTLLLPFGFDVSDEVYEACRLEEEVSRVCFIGNPDPARAGFINELAAANIPIDIFGSPAWSRAITNKGVTVHPAIYGDDFWKALRRYRVQLNLMRPHNENSHNMRSFEIPAIGGIMLAPATDEHRLFFEDSEEAFLFTGPDSCIEKAREILSITRDQAGVVRDRARGRSIKDGYSYRDRAKFVFQEIQKLYAEARHSSF